MEIKTQRKIAIVSGALGYVGKAVCLRLAEDGFQVVLIHRSNNEETISANLALLSGSVHKAYYCDLVLYEEVKNVLEKIRIDIGMPDLIVHAAGQQPERKKIYTTTKEAFTIQVEQNIIASFNFLTLSAQLIQTSQKGVIIGITTAGVVKKEATKSLGGYIPAKYAVQGMLTMLRDELAPHIRVYSLAPGFMEDGMNKTIPKAFVEMIKSKSKCGTLATAESVASSIVKLFNKETTLDDKLTILVAPEYS